MKALLCKQYGPPSSLVVEEIPSLKAEKGQVVIDVKACGVNFPDTLIIEGKYQFKPPFPFSPGGEVAGVVKEVGEGVAHLKVGDNVFAMTGWGGFAQEVAVAANRAFPMPVGMDYAVAASLMYTYGTSYHALKDRASLQAGETLLVLGAAGGVGLAALNLGKIMGAKVIAAASNPEKLALCQVYGADELIDYTQEDLRERLKAIGGVDVIYDPVGGPYTEPALRAMNWKGRYLVVGFAAGQIPNIPLNLPLLKGCAVMGVFWGSFAEREPKANYQNVLELLEFYRNGQMKPHIQRICSLEEAPEALYDMLERRVMGKLVVAP
ncbi:MAG: NADPH:quinone oxidoreductase family protein [Runella slithyformis]|nr:MAG: NADPH:quinone oxidoreductase family protein [Cytophagales bacterium]TAG40604.1 MAG: NADPH:quinone oxidoreductase family protein [Cytophagia bacterium]TAG51426.1 MAG: NADPH:quinone oxidoreductase family protein [Runella slithyformis]TAG73905.1 MAG: NADPH:quinone oxidoreductase family protein [Runella slithyformis]TAG83648.1 MAG: NADPH:quinone oxidoreductase family protein [Cytophagales bacterium]